MEYSRLKKKHLSFVAAHSQMKQHFSKIDQEKRKIEQIYIWNPMTSGFIK